MTTTPRKRTAAKTAAPKRTPRPVARPVDEDGDYAAADAQESEADEGHYVTATLVDDEVRIVPPGVWRQSWMRLLRQGELDSFAALVIHPDDLDLYNDIDPTNDQLGEFVDAAASASGESQGKSRGPNRSSRRTQRR